MKSSYQIGLLLLGVGLITVFVILLNHSREPVYQGKTLSVWLTEFDRKHPDERQIAAAKAIRSFGTNVLPRLVAQLQARDHPLKLFVINLFQMPIERIENECVYLKRRHAMVAFDALGSEARSAIPELMALFASDNTYVPGALAGIGSDAMPALTNALVSRVPFVAGNVARAIGAAVFREKIPRSKAQVVFPALLLNLKDENPHTRKYAAEALGDIGTDPSKVVPALVELLSDSEPSVRAHAASALRGFRESALTALPALTNALTDPDPTVRQKAAAALQAIDEASLKSN